MNKWYVVILVICVLAFSLWYYANYNKVVYIESDTKVVESTEISTNEYVTNEIVAHIVGEVKKPGVYTIKKGARIVDLVDTAGGFTPEADYESINLAAYVEDAQQVIIKNVNQKVDKSENTSQNSSVTLININTAEKEELKALSGVGDVLAESIINYREKNGGFKTIAEIKNVSGIGDKIYEDIKDNIIC